MKIAAIIVSYNSARELPLSLGCLGALPVDDVVVVDNSSTDDSVEVAKSFGYPVVSLPNVGFGKAINAAAETLPDADAYFLLNPDCHIDPESFAHLVEALRADSKLGVVAPLMRYPDGRFGISAGPEPSIAKEWLAALKVDHLVPRRLKQHLARATPLRKKFKMLEYLDVEPTGQVRETAWVSGFCMLVRGEAFRSIGGFDPRFFLYFEDVDLCTQLRAGGWGVASVGTSVAEHKESTSTGAVGKNPLYRSGMYVYFAKHGTRGQRLLASALRRLPI
ncbi:N-acetylglucosaminyl-diphospho-decaprenol L-rhamnosyltransferase [Micromonospora sp. M71_S20]|uniref:glycosyltransferase family 2 protein n=1 Tax=Micromonospora sp. M71_S20 TaxID=592872 RepID=UPI000F207307|nr:glycosyltransferase family 2 protein [Micromonospora sp. M71_S20]RLK23248.1 N-acetylglucosaminyl-diphospho-decaprenol L-rhamnosyltransferase [Micromonospora sp. M71_S20]